MPAFDQGPIIVPGNGQTPDLVLTWSRAVSPSGVRPAAFAYADITKLPDIPSLMGGVLSGRFTAFGIILFRGDTPTQEQAANFGGSVVNAINQFDPLLANAGPPGPGLVLWLSAFGAFDYTKTLGLFFQPTSALAFPLYDSFNHRLYNAGDDTGGDHRLLSVPSNAAGVALDTNSSDNLNFSFPDQATLPLAFAGGIPAGAAIQAATLSVILSGDQAGCISVAGNVAPGGAWRNFELGFQHGLLSDEIPPVPSRLCHPLVDAAYDFAGTPVTATLHPLLPTEQTLNTLAFTTGLTPIVSAFRSRLNDPIVLTPLSGTAGFVAATTLPTPQPNAMGVGPRAYFVPTGGFALGANGPASASGDIELRCGLSGVEYLRLASNDVLTFFPGQASQVAYDPAPDASNALHPIFQDASDACTTAWATLTPAAAQSFISENDAGPFFTARAGMAEVPLFFQPLGLAPLGAQTASPLMPLLPYAAFAPPSAAAAPLAAAFETGFIGPRRLQALTAQPAAALDAVDDASAITPQGYIARIAQGQLVSLKLGSFADNNGNSATLNFTGDNGGALPPTLCQAFLANQQFIVATLLPCGTASATLSGWSFDVGAGHASVPGAYQSLLIIKSASGTLKQLAAQPAAWTAYKTFNQGPDPKAPSYYPLDPGGTILSAWLVQYFARAESLYNEGSADGVAALQTFVELINDPDWNGYVFLQVPVLRANVSDLGFLMAGLDPNTTLNAHHLGCSVNRTMPDDKGVYQANSSYFGLVHYSRSDEGAGGSGSSAPPSAAQASYAFQLLSLQALFENSALAHFACSARLVLNTLFGEPISSRSPDPAVSATNQVSILGLMQERDGLPHYTFSTPKGYVGTLFPKSAALQRVVVDHATVQVGQDTANFVLSGWLGTLSDPGGFDVLSCQAVGFDQLVLQMAFGAGQPGTFPNPPDTSAMTLAQLPVIAVDAQAEVTTNAAAANVLCRPGSLAAVFPLEVTAFVTGDSARLPTALGYRELKSAGTAVPLTPGAAWFGLELDLPLGGSGALSSQALLNGKLLLAWTPGAGDGVTPAIQPFFLLEGPDGATLTMSIEGVLKLGAEDIALLRLPVGAADANFVLEFTSIGVSILGKSFPSRGAATLRLSTIPGTARNLSWFASYAHS